MLITFAHVRRHCDVAARRRSPARRGLAPATLQARSRARCRRCSALCPPRHLRDARAFAEPTKAAAPSTRHMCAAPSPAAGRRRGTNPGWSDRILRRTGASGARAAQPRRRAWLTSARVHAVGAGAVAGTGYALLLNEPALVAARNTGASCGIVALTFCSLQELCRLLRQADGPENSLLARPVSLLAAHRRDLADASMDCAGWRGGRRAFARRAPRQSVCAARRNRDRHRRVRRAPRAGRARDRLFQRPARGVGALLCGSRTRRCRADVSCAACSATPTCGPGFPSGVLATRKSQCGRRRSQRALRAQPGAPAATRLLPNERSWTGPGQRARRTGTRDLHEPACKIWRAGAVLARAASEDSRVTRRATADRRR